jgi:hypothetical protein
MVHDITVDMTDERPCNLRCAAPHHHGTFCRRYPHCAAGMLHKVEGLFGHEHTIHTVTRDEKLRSHQGGYSQNRILENPADGTTIEEVELHCRTLKFESLLPTKPDSRR